MYRWNAQVGRSAAAAEGRAAGRISHIADLDHHGAYVLMHDLNCPTLFLCHEGSGEGTARDAGLMDYADDKKSATATS